jgi:hypothetical protein
MADGELLLLADDFPKQDLFTNSISAQLATRTPTNSKST